MDLPFLILLVLGILVCSYLSWISTQSLLQARLLFRLARRPSQAPDDRGRQAFYGRVSVARPLEKGFGALLWCRTEHQVYRRRGKSSSWRTESSRDETADFRIEAHGGPVSLADAPTEVQRTKSRTEVLERTGWFGLGAGHGDRRVVYTFLPVCPYATVVGRHRDRDAVERDNKLGLLLSPREPGEAAWFEVLKGLAGLAAVTAVIAVVLWFRYARR